MKIYQDQNPKNFPYFVLVAENTGNRTFENQYYGFFSIADAKYFINHEESKNLIFV